MLIGLIRDNREHSQAGWLELSGNFRGVNEALASEIQWLATLYMLRDYSGYDSLSM